MTYIACKQAKPTHSHRQHDVLCRRDKTPVCAQTHTHTFWSAARARCHIIYSYTHTFTCTILHYTPSHRTVADDQHRVVSTGNECKTLCPPTARVGPYIDKWNDHESRVAHRAAHQQRRQPRTPMLFTHMHANIIFYVIILRSGTYIHVRRCAVCVCVCCVCCSSCSSFCIDHRPRHHNARIAPYRQRASH